MLSEPSCLPASGGTFEVGWVAPTSSVGIAGFWLAVASTVDEPGSNRISAPLAVPVAEPGVSWHGMGTMLSWRAPFSALPTGASANHFRVRACDKRGRCADSPWSAGLVRLTEEPSAGVAELVLSSRTELSVSFSAFTAAGCPALCGQGSGALCFYDPTCSDTPPHLGGAGCDAGGVGRNCRRCGAQPAKPCPTSASPPAAPVATNISYEVCVGTTPFGCQTLPFAPASGGAWQEANLDLHCGTTYYATVRATNCAGLHRTVASAPSKLCCEPPTAGTVQLLGPSDEPVAFVDGGNATLRASWTGFADSCAGVEEYSIELSESGGNVV